MGLLGFIRTSCLFVTGRAAAKCIIQIVRVPAKRVPGYKPTSWCMQVNVWLEWRTQPIRTVTAGKFPCVRLCCFVCALTSDLVGFLLLLLFIYPFFSFFSYEKPRSFLYNLNPVRASLLFAV